MATEILTWWLVIQAIGLLSLPVTTFLFRALPDRGYAFSKSLGLLLVSYIAWLLAMFGLGSFGVPLLLFVALLLVVGSLLLARALHRGEQQNEQETNPPPPSRFGSIAVRTLNFVRHRWPDILFYEGLFAVALVLVALMRAHQPDPWGTERPMDFAFFNAIQKSGTFPPNDPWLAGYSINYYYFGYLMMATMSLLSGLTPSVGFNLSMALIFALTALNVAGVLCNMVLISMGVGTPEQEKQEEKQPETATAPPPPPPLRRYGARYLVALPGVVLVLLAGNQAGALQLITGDHRVVALDAHQLGSALVQAAQGKEEIVLPSPVHTPPNEFGTFEQLEPTNRFEDFNWWWPSRTLWDEHPAPEEGTPGAPAGTDAPAIRIYNITEFPFFSFWLGDMHPHVMALPYGVLALALALATLARAEVTAFAASWRGWLDLLLTGIIIGSLYVINSWDLPTYTLLYGGALFLLFVRHNDDPDNFPWKRLGLQLAMVVGTMLLLFIPFYLTFKSLVGSAEPLTSIPLLAKLTQIIAPLGVRSGLHAFVIIFGLFALPLFAFTYAPAPDQTPPQPATPSEEPAAPAQPSLLPWLAPALLLVGLFIGFPLLALAGVGLYAFGRAMHRAAAAPAAAFALLVVALGCAICFGTDLIYIRDVFSTRMNTIFKFYYQVWLLWGTLAAWAAWWLLLRKSSTQQQSNLQRWGTLAGRLAVGAGMVVLLAGGFVYPAVNLSHMVERDTMEGLDGRTPREHSPAGRAAIEWVRENLGPGDVILEMVAPEGGSYNPYGYAGVSASTGIPTVLGWYGHESQWRGGDEPAKAELGPRRSDVDTIYSTTSIEKARKLLETYGVTHIYVGELEQQEYSPESLAKFEQLAAEVFEQGEITIYRLPETTTTP
jgi:YYY domain-containing protein